MKHFEKKYTKYIESVAKTLLLDSLYPVTLREKDLGDSAWATFEGTYPYKNLTINYDKSLTKESDSKIKDILTHEVCHALTDPLYIVGHNRYVTKDELNDRREELTDHLANIFRKNKLT